MDTELLSVRIRQYRERNGMTQKDLAAKIGVAPFYILCIEQGVKKPSLDKLMEICALCQISLADIVCVKARDAVAAKAKWIKEIVEVLSALETDQVRMIKTMVKALNVRRPWREKRRRAR